MCAQAHREERRGRQSTAALEAVAVRLVAICGPSLLDAVAGQDGSEELASVVLAASTEP